MLKQLIDFCGLVDGLFEPQVGEFPSGRQKQGEGFIVVGLELEVGLAGNDSTAKEPVWKRPV